MKSKKDIDTKIAFADKKLTLPSGNRRSDQELEGRLKGLEWGRNRSKKEIEEEIDRLEQLGPVDKYGLEDCLKQLGLADKYGLGDRYLQAHIRALQWIVRSYEDEKKGRAQQKRNTIRTGGTPLWETHIKARR